MTPSVLNIRKVRSECHSNLFEAMRRRLPERGDAALGQRTGIKLLEAGVGITLAQQNDSVGRGLT
jgi:hypothetical protein